MRRLLIAAIVVVAGVAGPDQTAQAELRQPRVERFFVEAFLGAVIPLTELDVPNVTNLGGTNVSWLPRLQLGIAGGARVWDPLNLDVGLRLGYSYQQYWKLGETRQSYDPSIDLLELVPFGRAAIYPFGSDHWGISMELGAGFLFAFGGKDGTQDTPKDSQSFFRLRVGFGAIWRIDSAQSILFDVLHLTTDIPVTKEYKDDVGTMLNFEMRASYLFRF